ncbi:MAG: hypothetical protein EOO20_23870 [Chryseobacterium sp.]|nr:MAG: hypothetical protein EOO20_23870 [Chryseobacterium sp.]
MELKGLSTEVTFFKDFAEKYGIGIEVIRHGKFKSAVEPFLRNDISPENKERFDLLQIIDSVVYLHDYILPKIKVSKKKKSIVLHPVCSLQKMEGLEKKFQTLANRFADHVTQPLFAGCCGMAGDRGFLYPELTQSATLKESTEVNSVGFDGYYSSSKTCEIALSDAVGKNYQSILMLVDECT